MFSYYQNTLFTSIINPLDIIDIVDSIEVVAVLKNKGMFMGFFAIIGVLALLGALFGEKDEECLCNCDYKNCPFYKNTDQNQQN